MRNRVSALLRASDSTLIAFSFKLSHRFSCKTSHQFYANHIYLLLYINACINHVSSLRFPLLCLSEKELTPVEAEPIVELAEDWEDVGWYNVAGIALAGCPSAKDVARIATQKRQTGCPQHERRGRREHRRRRGR